VYEEWVAREWREVSATVLAGGSALERAQRVVAIFLEHHRRWRGFRASLRALVASDTEVRDFYRQQRRKQLSLLARLRRALGRMAEGSGRNETVGGRGTREADALLLFTLERTADAFAEGEPEALALRPAALQSLIVDLVRVRIEAGPVPNDARPWSTRGRTG
jgi:hypothetical protein